MMMMFNHSELTVLTNQTDAADWKHPPRFAIILRRWVTRMSLLTVCGHQVYWSPPI